MLKKIQISKRLIILLIILLFSTVVCWWYILSPRTNVAEILKPVINSNALYYSILNGGVVTSTEAVAPQIVAVMIDNYPGISQSCLGVNGSVVYEAPVEGANTRFMQVVDSGVNVPEVGPVRSARPYYLDWLAEYGDALYMHCGGAPEALTLIKTRDIFDANEFYWGPYYWRDNKKIAPHNLFTNSEEWNSLLNKYGTTTNRIEWSGWEFFKDTSDVIGEPIKEISIKYFPGYKVTWRYQSNGKPTSYERFVNEEYQRSACSKDSNATAFPIMAHNIIVQFVQIETVDDVGRREIKTIGSGEAYVLRSGLLVRATWKKENLASRTRFYDGKNEEIKLVPGSTWVQVVPQGTVVEVTN